MNFRESIKCPPLRELREICQTPESSLNDSLYGKLFVRKISIYFTKIFIRIGLTGNQITWIWFLFDLIAGLFLTLGNYWASLIAVFLIHLGYILDGTDGEISRYRNSCSDRGIFLDHVFHSIAYPLLFFSLSLGVYNITNNIYYMILGFLSAFSFIQIELITLERHKILGKKLNSFSNNNISDDVRTRLLSNFNDFIRLDFFFIGIIVFSIFDILNFLLILIGMGLLLKFFIDFYKYTISGD